MNLVTLTFETQYKKNGYRNIAGVDEAGRGPLAGPVVAAAVILPSLFSFEEIDDSKKLPPALRLELSRKIRKEAIAYGVGKAEVKEIDRLNILQATYLAMRRALLKMKVRPDFILVDGNRPIVGVRLPQRAIVGGDGRAASIAAASILAKVARDQLMEKLDQKYPGYDFAVHKGYGTKAHLAALQKLGPCPIHRVSFDPLKSYLQNKLMAIDLTP